MVQRKIIKHKKGRVLNRFAIFNANKISRPKYQSVSYEWNKKYGFAADRLIFQLTYSVSHKNNKTIQCYTLPFECLMVFGWPYFLFCVLWAFFHEIPSLFHKIHSNIYPFLKDLHSKNSLFGVMSLKMLRFLCHKL